MVMYDLNWFFSRFRFADLCDSFPKDYRLKLGFTPLDLLRYRYHGKLTMNMRKNEVNIYKERNFTRQDLRFRITISKIEFFQCINYLEWVIKNINISKEVRKHYETQLLRIPLIETILRFQYNNAEINNHYRDVGCQTIEEYMENIKDYSTQNIAIEIMLHVPSLRNKDVLEAVDSHLLLSYFIKQSYVPVLHFQKSYMAEIYNFMCEYIFKKDYSVKDTVPQYPINYNIKGKLLVSDLIAIFSEFDEKKLEVREQNDRVIKEEGLFTSEDRNKEDQEGYLDIYDGLIVSLENFFVMNDMEIIHIGDHATERMKLRIGDAESW